MAKKYRDTDYLCLSAQIRSRENALLRRSQLDRMLESGDAKQAARILAEQGWESFDPTQPGALDAAILTQREALYRELSGQLPVNAVLGAAIAYLLLNPLLSRSPNKPEEVLHAD